MNAGADLFYGSQNCGSEGLGAGSPAGDPAEVGDFHLYPNPAHGEFFLHFQEEGPKSITVLDLSGRIVHSWSNVAGKLNHFSAEGLARGAYWVRATDGRRSATKKLLVH
jgi:hypothetical protein